jgi:hypothetical protein
MQLKALEEYLVLETEIIEMNVQFTVNLEAVCDNSFCHRESSICGENKAVLHLNS